MPREGGVVFRVRRLPEKVSQCDRSPVVVQRTLETEVVLDELVGVYQPKMAWIALKQRVNIALARVGQLLDSSVVSIGEGCSFVSAEVLRQLRLNRDDPIRRLDEDVEIRWRRARAEDRPLRLETQFREVRIAADDQARGVEAPGAEDIDGESAGREGGVEFGAVLCGRSKLAATSFSQVG